MKATASQMNKTRAERSIKHMEAKAAGITSKPKAEKIKKKPLAVPAWPFSKTTNPTAEITNPTIKTTNPTTEITNPTIKTTNPTIEITNPTAESADGTNPD